MTPYHLPPSMLHRELPLPPNSVTQNLSISGSQDLQRKGGQHENEAAIMAGSRPQGCVGWAGSNAESHYLQELAQEPLFLLGHLLLCQQLLLKQKQLLLIGEGRLGLLPFLGHS